MARTLPSLPAFEDPRTASELFWVKHQPFLETQGFMLRPRYHPDWHPSWILKDGTDLKAKYGFKVEDDNIFLHGSVLLDATRMKDGVKVVLRMVPVGSQELAMMEHLSSADMVRDPRNRTVPILGIIPIPGEEKQRVFVVLPMLRVFNSPPFHCRREFADAFRQILEGIHFMHEHNIAHGDACTSNFMMDATGVCPRGFHIAYPHSYNGVYHVLHERPRCLVSPVSYYIIDFETTRHFPAGRNDARATAMKCQIKNSPEFLCSPPLHNPFCLDVYNVGATFFRTCERYHGLDDFKPFFLTMMAEDPLFRPTTTTALEEFDTFMAAKDVIWMRSRIWPNDSLHKPPSRLVQFLWRKFPSLLPYF